MPHACAAPYAVRLRVAVQSGVHVDAEVNTTSPQTVVAAFSSGSSVSSALQPGGFSIDPTTVKVCEQAEHREGNEG